LRIASRNRYNPPAVPNAWYSRRYLIKPHQKGGKVLYTPLRELHRRVFDEIFKDTFLVKAN
jgi:hypothetical protein